MQNTEELSKNIHSTMQGNRKIDVSRVKDYITTITILDTISDPIFILSASGQIEYVNQNAYQLFSTEFNALVGKSFKELIVSENLAASHSADNSSDSFFNDLLVSSLLDIETELAFNNIRIPALVNSNPVYDTAGKLEFIVVTTVNLSRREFQLQERQQNHAESIYYNRMRTIGEMGISVIHELSQPLLSLNILLDMLKGELRPESEQGSAGAYVEQMQNLVNKMSHTVEYIRSFTSKSEKAGFELLEPQAVIDGLQQYLSYELQEKKIALNIQHGDTEQLIYANPLMLEQALLNLLKNSIEAFPSADETSGTHPEIKIQAKTIRDIRIDIIIDDNGNGISPEIREKIFRPFFTTKSDPTNTGVGLTISKGIITSFGGSIELLTKKTRGTRFKISLPLASANEATQLYNLIEIQQMHRELS